MTTNQISYLILLHILLILDQTFYVESNCKPLSSRTGVQILCENHITRESVDCQYDKAPFGTIAKYNCQNLHFTNDGESYGGSLQCNRRGEWEPDELFRGFSCFAACGNLINNRAEKWPWQAAIFLKDSRTDDEIFLSSGTLVNPFNSAFYIITASKNLLSESTKAYLPTQSLVVKLGAPQNIKSYSVKNIKFMANNFNEGLALIKLNGENIISENIIPACFSGNPNFYDEEASNSKEFMIGGFGLVESFSRNNQALLNFKVNKVTPLATSCNGMSQTRTICAGSDIPNKKVICNGESGSGLISLVGKKHYIMGILVQNNKACKNFGSFLMLNHNSIEWIKKSIVEFDLEKYDGENINNQSQPSQPDSEIRFNSGFIPKRPTVSPQTRPGSRSTTLAPTTVRNNFAYSQQRPKNPLVSQIPDISIPSQYEFRDFEISSLKVHNEYRKKEKLYPYKLSPKLSEEAQNDADYSIRHNNYNFNGIVNWFGVRDGNFPLARLAEEAVKDWYISKLDPYFLIVSQNMTEIGVGVASQGDKQIVIVRYH